MADVRTPLLDRQGLPLPIGSSNVQDHVRIDHSSGSDGDPQSN